MHPSRIVPFIGRGALVAALLALTPLASVAAAVGTVAAVEGTAAVVHGGVPAPAAPGTPVALGDELRTGRPGRMRVVFTDDSVLTLGDESTLTVDTHVFNPSGGAVRSLFSLVQGKVAAVVSQYYHQAGAQYELRTRNAVAGVRGTEFVVSYAPDTDVTEVLGISGVVSVHSAIDPTAPGMLITASEVTTVVAGQAPTPPRHLDQTIFQQELRGFEFLGADGLSSTHPAVSGASVPRPDQAPAGGAAPGTSTGMGVTHEGTLQPHDASSLIGQSPGSVVGRTNLGPSTGGFVLDPGKPH